MPAHTIIVITGQTATGKTAFAYTLSKQLNGEVMNADARHIYQGLSIVTGKDMVNDVPIRLMDLIPLDRTFSSFEYAQLAQSVIADIWKRGKIPIIVGGTYLYIHHLLYMINTNTKPDWDLRSSLAKKSVAELQAIIKTKFPAVFRAMNNSDKNNPQRLIRKIEMGDRATTTFPSFTLRPEFACADIQLIGIRHTSQENAAKRIRERVHYRLAHGAVSEISEIVQKGIPLTVPGLHTIGCPQIIKYIQGALSREELERIWTTKETQYAKRQLTIMKKNKNIQWRYTDPSPIGAYERLCR